MEEIKHSGAANWTFLTNHAHVLVCLAGEGEGEPTLRAIALRIGITERAVQRIVADLEAAGVISRRKKGRRNTYQVETGARLRHDLEADIGWQPAPWLKEHAILPHDSLGANVSTSSPRAIPRSTYVNPSASVNASSCAAVAPASRMW